MEKQILDEVVGEALFAELVQTAAIDLQPDEAEALRKELSLKMEVIRQLEIIPLSDSISPVIHGNPYPPAIRCGLREDKWIPFDAPDAIVRQAPLSQDGFIVSPDVPHQRIG